MTQDANFTLDDPNGVRVHISDVNAKLIANAQDAETRLTANAASAAARMTTAPVSVTASSAFVATDAGCTFVNNTATARTKTLIAGLGQVILEQSSSGTLSVVAGAGVTVNGVTTTSVNQRRVWVTEVAAGVYEGTASAPTNLGTAAFSNTGDFATAAQGAKADGSLQAANNLSDILNAVTARANLGLGSAATQASSAFDAAGAAASAQAAAQAYTDSKLVNAWIAKGTIDASANPNYPAATAGWVYIFSAAGKIGGASGKAVDVGDFLFCNTTNAGGTEAAVGASWSVLEHNLIGALLAGNNLSDIPSPSTARTNLGLGNVDNVADISKPVSNPQAAAIALRMPIAPTLVTAGRALTAADSGAVIINASSPAAAASFSLIPGLGQVFLEQKLGTAPLSVTVGTATTLTGMTTTSLTFPRIRVVEVAAGVYRGEADSWAFPDPGVPGDLEDALDAAHNSSTPLTIFGMPNAKYTLIRQANVDVYKTSMIGYNNSIDCSAITYGPAITWGYTSSFSSGPEIRKAKARRYEGWEVYGNTTTNVPGTIGLWTHGTVPQNAPRPTFRDFFVHDFETGIGGRDQFYLSQLDGLESYSCVYGFWQQCGNDAGESIIINGGVLDNNWTAIRVDDPSSELVINGTSTDYCRQRLVVHNQAKVTFYAAHDENRGKNLISDNNNYILDGSGSDARAAIQGFSTWADGQRFIWSPIATNTSTTVTFAPSGGLASKTIKKFQNGVSGAVVALAVGDIVNGQPMELQYNLANDCLVWIQTRTYYNMPCATQIGGSANAVTCSAFVTRDVFMDCDGDGTVVRCDGGNFNINASGGAGPYTYYRLVKVRHAGTRVIFDRVYKENSLNIADHFWDGPGVVITNFLTRAGSNPQNITCYNHQSAYNLVADPGFSLALGKAAVWWIRLDTNSTIPTSRYTGTNGSITTVTPAVGNATATTWSIAGEVLTVGGTITNKFVRGMTISGTGVTACKIIGPLTDTTGGAGNYLIETSQTVAGSGTLTGTISKALQITRTATATDTTGKLNISTIQRMTVDRRVGSKFLILIPSTGGMSTGNVFLNVQYARLSPDNDANGVPQVVELFNAWAAQTINTATFAKDVWVDLPLAAFGVGVDAPPGATHVLWDFNTQNVSSTSGGVLLCSQQHASLG